MSDDVKTWHYGPMAREWAENSTTGPEIDYFARLIRVHGQPALDAGCGTGRLLIPFLRAGLDVDGCDVSDDMLAFPREIAQREGLRVGLYCQALHNLDLPRRYKTIVACGVFGIGVNRDQDLETLRRFHAHLEPGGVLLLQNHVPYNDKKIWPLWQRDARSDLPWSWPADILGPAADDRPYALHHRLVAFDPLEQQLTREMRMLVYSDRKVVSDRTYPLTENLYFRNELRMLLAHAGLIVQAEFGDWTDAIATADHEVITFVARKANQSFA